MFPLRAEGPVREPQLAATLLLVREGASGLEVLCVQRSAKSAFLASALVFPGGKLDPADRRWAEQLPAAPHLSAFATDAEPQLGVALAVAAVRETLEEAAVLLATPRAALDAARAAALRDALAAGAPLRELMDRGGLQPDLCALHPFGRWITPTAEPKRYDTAFFLAEAPPNQDGACDAHETVACLWARPADLLTQWQREQVLMVPPTHACLELLAQCKDIAAARALAAQLPSAPITPERIDLDGELALVLPGDPRFTGAPFAHPFPQRYLLRGRRLVPTRN